MNLIEAISEAATAARKFLKKHWRITAAVGIGLIVFGILTAGIIFAWPLIPAALAAWAIPMGALGLFTPLAFIATITSPIWQAVVIGVLAFAVIQAAFLVYNLIRYIDGAIDVVMDTEEPLSSEVVDKVQALTEELDAQVTATESINNRLRSMESQIELQNVIVEKIETETNATRGTVTTMEDTVNNATTRAIKASSEATKAEASLSSLQIEQKTVRKQVKGMEKTVEALEKKLQGNSKGTEKSVNDLKEELSKTQKQIDIVRKTQVESNALTSSLNDTLEIHTKQFRDIPGNVYTNPALQQQATMPVTASNNANASNDSGKGNDLSFKMFSDKKIPKKEEEQDQNENDSSSDDDETNAPLMKKSANTTNTTNDPIDSPPQQNSKV